MSAEPGAAPAPRQVFRRSAGDLEAAIAACLGGKIDEIDVLSLAKAPDLFWHLHLTAGEGRLDRCEKGFKRCLYMALRAIFSRNEVDEKDLEVRTAALISSVCRWALWAAGGGFPSEVTPWARRDGPRQQAFTAEECRGLLANALLMNVHDTSSDLKQFKGGLDFAAMICANDSVAMGKLACLLQYFETSRAEEASGRFDGAREVLVSRRCAQAAGVGSDLDEFKAWLENACDSSPACGADQVVLHDEVMEAVQADAFVNFANANFGYGKFIASCTQEEIIQVCCPEFNVGMLLEGMMTDEEVVVVHGCRRFSCYTGYADRFCYTGPWTQQPAVQDIVTLDATTCAHFSEAMVLRDVRKAYLGFMGCRCVSTGRWGCGVFGGMPSHKFAQQILAACLAGCAIQLSTFGTPDQCDEVLAAIIEARPSKRQLLKALLQASAAKREGIIHAGGFVSRFIALLPEAPAAEAGGGGAVADGSGDEEDTAALLC